MGEPITQALFIEIIQQLEKRIETGHSSVRQSLNELRVEMTNGFNRIGNRCEDHSKRLVVIETTDAVETEANRARKQDTRDKTMLLTTLTSIIVTVVLFGLKALFRL